MTVKHSNEVEAKNVSAGKDTTIQVLISSQEGPNFALRKFSMLPGGGMPRHTNTVEHEQYVLRGHAKIGSVKKPGSETGDVVFIPWCAALLRKHRQSRLSFCVLSPTRKIRSRLWMKQTVDRCRGEVAPTMASS
jgi:hypothetical protein